MPMEESLTPQAQPTRSDSMRHPVQSPSRSEPQSHSDAVADVGEAAPSSSELARHGRVSPRTRMISFRVSDQEFEQLRLRSESEGARSISDFARSALCEQARAGVADLDRLSDEVQRLGSYVARVTELIEGRESAVDPTPQGRREKDES